MTKEVVFTPHALMRIEQMGVSEEDVLNTIKYGAWYRQTDRPRHHKVHQYGAIGVVVAHEDVKSVITVIWNTSGNPDRKFHRSNP